MTKTHTPANPIRVVTHAAATLRGCGDELAAWAKDGLATVTSEELATMRTDLATTADKLADASQIMLRESTDLVAALGMAFVALGRAGGNTSDSPYRDAWLVCRAAIQKAEGKE